MDNYYNYYYSFKIFLCFWLVKTTHIIHHNQLLLTKYWTNDVKSAACCKLSNRWCHNDVKSAARCRLLNHWPRKPGDKVVLFCQVEKQRAKWQNSFKNGEILEWIIKQLLNLASIWYKEICRSCRCYPTRPSASADNTLLDLQNFSYPTQSHSISMGYWPSARSRWLDIGQVLFCKFRMRPISSHLDQANLVNKGSIIWLSG